MKEITYNRSQEPGEDFEKLLAAAQRGEFEKVVVYAPWVLGKDPLTQEQNIAKIHATGVSLQFVHPDQVTGPPDSSLTSMSRQDFERTFENLGLEITHSMLQEARDSDSCFIDVVAVFVVRPGDLRIRVRSLYAAEYGDGEGLRFAEEQTDLRLEEQSIESFKINAEVSLSVDEKAIPEPAAAVLFLKTPAKRSVVTYQPEYGDREGLEDVKRISKEIEPLLSENEQLEIRLIKLDLTHPQIQKTVPAKTSLRNLAHVRDEAARLLAKETGKTEEELKKELENLSDEAFYERVKKSFRRQALREDGFVETVEGDPRGRLGDKGKKFVELLNALQRVAREIVLPTPTSAQNIEVLAMSAAHWISTEHQIWGDFSDWSEEYIKEKAPEIHRAFLRLMPILSFNEEPLLFDFLIGWKQQAYARLEVGGQLAWALAFTDEPEDVRSPWTAWSLLPPDRFLGPVEGPYVARLWCLGSEPIFAVLSSPDIEAKITQGALLNTDNGGISLICRFQDLRQQIREACRCLVRGACATATSPSCIQKRGKHGGKVRSRFMRHGAPPEGIHYVLTTPVEIDLRSKIPQLREYLLSNRKGSAAHAPKVQFLVRGHWRHQPHGPARSLRRLQWIEPFWKGEKSALIALRKHQMEHEDDKGSKDNPKSNKDPENGN